MCDTFDICPSTEESAFAGKYSEDCVWVLIEMAERGDDVLNQVATKGIQRFGAVELGEVR